MSVYLNPQFTNPLLAVIAIIATPPTYDLEETALASAKIELSTITIAEEALASA